MKNDVLDAEKPMLMLADWLEAERYHAGLIAAQADALILDSAVNARRARAAVRELDPARIRQLASLLAQLHPLAVTASSSTGAASEVRKARDELVKLCLELGGEA